MEKREFAIIITDVNTNKKSVATSLVRAMGVIGHEESTTGKHYISVKNKLAYKQEKKIFFDDAEGQRVMIERVRVNKPINHE